MAQVAALSNKEVMTSMTIPASNALFGVSEKPSAQEWAELRKQALILSESGALLLKPGRVPGKKDNPGDWTKAAKLLQDSGKKALAAIDKKNAAALSGDISGMMLDSCTSCHEKYMAK